MAGQQVLSDNQSLPLPFPASTAVSKFDLLYWDAANLVCKPAALYTTTGTEATDQAAIAPLFVGVAGDVRLASEADANAIRNVITDGIFDFDCVNGYTPALGDVVAITYGNAGTTFQNQMVKKTTTKANGIGIVIGIPTQQGNAQSWGNAATKVRVRLTGKLTYDLVNHP